MPDYEKLSYGKTAYKRVQKLRRRGKRRGIQVPYLGYELNKPEKPRVIFWVIGAVSAVLLIAAIVGIIFLYNELLKSTMFTGIGDVFTAVFDPAAFALSAGLSTIPALIVVLAYVLLFILFLVPIGLLIYVYRFVRDVFYMAKCSKEEFAKGNIITGRITGFLAAIAITVAVFVAILIISDSSSAKLLAGLVAAGIVVILGGLTAVMTVEKRKCAKWFDNLDEFKKQNYLTHERALRSVKRRLKTEKYFWENIGK